MNKEVIKSKIWNWLVSQNESLLKKWETVIFEQKIIFGKTGPLYVINISLYKKLDIDNFLNNEGYSISIRIDDEHVMCQMLDESFFATIREDDSSLLETREWPKNHSDIMDDKQISCEINLAISDWIKEYE
jgi:hypothetical protein